MRIHHFISRKCKEISGATGVHPQGTGGVTWRLSFPVLSLRSPGIFVSIGSATSGSRLKVAVSPVMLLSLLLLLPQPPARHNKSVAIDNSAGIRFNIFISVIFVVNKISAGCLLEAEYRQQRVTDFCYRGFNDSFGAAICKNFPVITTSVKEHGKKNCPYRLLR